MIAKLRIVLICMIVLAVPVQGIAAATMRFCAPGHHSQDMSATAASPAHGHAGHAAASAAPHHHAQQPAADMADDESDDESDGASGATSKMKCSVCAVCCMATGLAPDAPTVHLIEAGSKITLPAKLSYVGPFADGLERPPRSFLA